jgi:DNA-binding transcriptional regulator YiaG
MNMKKQSRSTGPKSRDKLSAQAHTSVVSLGPFGQKLDRAFREIFEDRLTVRQVEVPDPGQYPPASVRRLRQELGVSQPVFARLMGVSTVLVQSWEQGQRIPSPMARRLLDEIRRDPRRWAQTLRPVA